ncbi:uncharacterized protein DS421_16g536890 [Arachis hypogaea]|nr:uncharacterized protein DS421_16g536890 [Arachis hypogaea]
MTSLSIFCSSTTSPRVHAQQPVEGVIAGCRSLHQQEPRPLPLQRRRRPSLAPLEKNVESLVKLLVDCILEAKENIDRNFAASLRNENMVTSTADVLTLMKLSEVNRAVSFAALNNRSSPSHSVLPMHVHGKDT